MSTMGVAQEAVSPLPPPASTSHAAEAQSQGEVYLFEPAFAQQRLWFLSRLDPGSATYNLPIAMRLSGALDPSGLERALNEVVRRHESLRTTFAEVDGRAVQVVCPSLTLQLGRMDLSGEPNERRELRMHEEAAREARIPFDLERGPLIRARLLKLGERDHVALLTMHHIVSDGWSMRVLVGEVGALYGAFVEGMPSPLAPLPIQVADFAHWQRQSLEGEPLQAQLSYWKNRLAGFPAALELPTDRPRPAVQTFRGAAHRLLLPATLADGLRRLCHLEGVTLYMALLGAFKALLHRITGQTDICVGSPIANRSRAELEGLIGFFVNTLVLRTDLSSSPTFRELLQRVRETALGAYAHQDVPFERLVEELAPRRDLTRTPLFQVAFALQHAPASELKLPGLTLTPIACESGTSKFDLTLEVTDSAGSLQCTFEFNSDLFDAATIERLAGHFEMLLGEAIANPNLPIGTLAILRGAEREQLVVDWNRTSRDYPCERTFLDLFEAQAATAPNATALRFEGKELRYEELNRQAERLAREVRALANDSSRPVAVLLERSIPLVVAELAILKSGASYLPIDPSHPFERIQLILADSRAQLLLSRAKLIDGLQLAGSCRAHLLDRKQGGLGAEKARDLESRPAPRDLAYVIYTSGSTGAPKGVAVEHRALMRLIAWHGSAYCTGPATRAAQLAGPAFDAAAWEVWPTLAFGGSVDIVPDEVRASPGPLLQWLASRQITLAFAPTALADLLVRQPMPRDLRLKVLLTGGDKLQRGVPPGLPFALVNHYGPTESAVVATCAPVGEEPLAGPPSIGRPIDNTQAYVLDVRRQLLPVGAYGELCLGGDGLARGYLNRPRLTAERFIPDPFGEASGGRLYCTGDRVRHRADGNLEFAGRLDRQVKVRGFRVEMGEVEAALAQHPAVRETVVVASNDRGHEKRLIAYVVARQNVAVGELRAYLAGKLPDYMLPSSFVALSALPLTPNGKVDRDALPAPDGFRPASVADFAAPHTQAQKILASVWSELLGVAPIGIHDNFFELGGDSILSIQVIARARQRGLSLSPRDLFQHQTIAALAHAASLAPAPLAEQGTLSGPVPLAPIQAWFCEQGFPAPHHFNQALSLRVEPGFKAELLRPCVQHLLAHHDALRLRLRPNGAGFLQHMAESETHEVVQIVDLSAMPESAQDAAAQACADDLQASLDLANGPILRVAFFDQGASGPGRLLVVIHHLAVDAVSWRILLEDLQSLYQSASRGEPPALPPKTTSFKHWAERLHNYSAFDVVECQRDYWRALGRGSLVALPIDHPGAPNTFGSLKHVAVRLDEEETRALQNAPATYRAQVQDVLLTALALALRSWAGAGRVLIDLEGHGRETPFAEVDLSRTVGWFTCLYPVAVDVGPSGDLWLGLEIREGAASRGSEQGARLRTASLSLARFRGASVPARRDAGLQLSGPDPLFRAFPRRLRVLRPKPRSLGPALPPARRQRRDQRRPTPGDPRLRRAAARPRHPRAPRAVVPDRAAGPHCPLPVPGGGRLHAVGLSARAARSGYARPAFLRPS